MKFYSKEFFAQENKKWLEEKKVIRMYHLISLPMRNVDFDWNHIISLLPYSSRIRKILHSSVIKTFWNRIMTEMSYRLPLPEGNQDQIGFFVLRPFFSQNLDRNQDSDWEHMDAWRCESVGEKEKKLINWRRDGCNLPIRSDCEHFLLNKCKYSGFQFNTHSKY